MHVTARLSFLAAACIVFLSAHAARARAEDNAPAKPKRKPNVVFLFTDDQRADTIAALGNAVIKTPVLDALVRRGFAFENAYCFGSNVPAVCSPSRNMLLSGRAYFRFGKQALPDQPNFAASMKKAGYITYHYGKRGNTAVELQKVFDVNKTLADDEGVRRSGEPGKLIVDDALEFVKKQDAERPVFLYLAFATPHDPRGASPRCLAMYDRAAIPLPKNYRPFHPFNNGELKVRDEKLAPWPRTEDEIRRHLHEYYAVITGLDEDIGKLMDGLKQLGRYDDTIFVFSSDHGLAIGSHGLMGKQSLYEHSMKAPLIFAGPGIPHGRSPAFAYLFDIFPTVCDLAGAGMPQGIDGRSLAPVMRAVAAGDDPAKAAPRDTIFTSYRDVQRAIRHGNWKLIRYPQIHKTQLFDLANDPDETRDLFGDPLQVKRVAELTRRLREQQAIYGDMLPLSAENPKKAEVDLSFFREGK